MLEAPDSCNEVGLTALTFIESDYALAWSVDKFESLWNRVACHGEAVCSTRFSASEESRFDTRPGFGCRGRQSTEGYPYL